MRIRSDGKTGSLAGVVVVVVLIVRVVVAVALMLSLLHNIVAGCFCSLLLGFMARCNDLSVCATSPFAAGGRLRGVRVYSP